MHNKLVSIIIVNWNGKKWLKNCFDSINEQSYKNIEVIFVDNNSIDDSAEYVTNNWPKTIIVNNNTNSGFAEGNNLGLKHAKGELIYLLNNDTMLEKSCVEELVAFINGNKKIASVQSKMIQLNNNKKLDVVGSYWTSTGFLYHYGAGGDASKKMYNTPLPVYSNKGASMMLRRSVVDKVGLFDSDFWCYYEEGDLCARFWLAGYECWYCPEAVMYHAGGGTSITFANDYIQFHNFKNKLLSFLKCFENETLFKVLPVYLFMNIVISLYWLVNGKVGHFLSLYNAIWWNVKNIKNTIKKRKSVQKMRATCDKDIFKIVKLKPGLKYYIALLTGDAKYYKDKDIITKYE